MVDIINECLSEILSFVIPFNLKNIPIKIFPFKLHFLFKENRNKSLKVIVGISLGFLLQIPSIFIYPSEQILQI